MTEQEVILSHLMDISQCLMGLFESGLSTVYDVSLKELNALCEKSSKLGMKYLSGELKLLYECVERETAVFDDNRSQIVDCYRKCFKIVNLGIDQINREMRERNYSE